MEGPCDPIERFLAVSKLIEPRISSSIRKFVHTARRYRSVRIKGAAES